MTKQRHVLTAAEILAAVDLAVEEVEVPEWGGVVLVRGLTGTERDAFEQSVVVVDGAGKGRRVHTNLANFRAKLAARCMVDEAGGLLFSEDQVAALGAKSGAALERVFSVAQRLSGLTQEDVEELTKN